MTAWNRPPLAVRIAAHATIYFAALLVLLPLLWMVVTALKTNAEAISRTPSILPRGGLAAFASWQWGNFRTGWEQAQLGRFYGNSLIVAIVVTVLSLVHNALAGFAFAKLRFRGRSLTFGLTLVTMLLPFQVYFIFVYIVCGWLGYVDSLQALIVPFLASAFGIFYMRQSIAGVPESLIEAGRIDGMSDGDVLRFIVVPSVKPAIAALAIFTFMASWNNFFWPLVVIDSAERFTLPLGVAALASGMYVPSWPVQMAAATIITLPTVLVFVIFQRAFVRGMALTGVKG